MDRLLLDTNIVIYLLNGEPTVIRWFRQFEEKPLVISIISWIEVLAGSFKHQKTIEEVAKTLEYFEVLPVQKTIGYHAAYAFETQLKKKKRIPGFQDGIIAATALAEKIPLVTNNPKDFRHFKGLKILTP